MSRTGNNKDYENENIDLISFANELNTLYFNKTLSYRGDILKWPEFKTKRGKELLKLLNIKIAVSNWQGNEGWIKMYLGLKNSLNYIEKKEINYESGQIHIRNNKKNSRIT